jgi:hypothetical protein
MAHALDEVLRLDRRWFWAHLKGGTAADGLSRASSIFAIASVARVWSSRARLRRLSARDLSGCAAAHEESAAALFALAATCPELAAVLAMSGREDAPFGQAHR